jgi:hypothetical protein
MKTNKTCPDECPTCGCDLRYQGYPEHHQDDRDGSECSWIWSPAEEMGRDEIYRVAEEIADGWYAEGRVDWQDFIDRLEKYTDVDFGCDMGSPLIKGVKAHIRAYRKL